MKRRAQKAFEAFQLISERWLTLKYPHPLLSIGLKSSTGAMLLFQQLVEMHRNRPPKPLTLYTLFSVLAVHIITTADRAFSLAKQRQDILPTLPRITRVSPMVIIVGLTTHIDHAVDR